MDGYEGTDYQLILADSAPLMLHEIRLALGDFQAGEVEHGMSVDADDGNPVWGRLERLAGREQFRLVIFGSRLARDRALYRITSSRDIWLDNAGAQLISADERKIYAAGGRSLSALAQRLVKACGGPEGFSPVYQRWIKY
jgi:hypothetical protein